MPPDVAPLTAFKPGQTVRLEWLGLDEAAAERLRGLGLREGCAACIMLNSDKCILGLGACRIALRREVAMSLFATHVA